MFNERLNGGLRRGDEVPFGVVTGVEAPSVEGDRGPPSAGGLAGEDRFAAAEVRAVGGLVDLLEVGRETWRREGTGVAGDADDLVAIDELDFAGTFQVT